MANDIVEHDLMFLTLKDSKLAYEKIKEKNYLVKQQEQSLLEEIIEISPDIVINAYLSTQNKKIGTKIA